MFVTSILKFLQRFQLKVEYASNKYEICVFYYNNVAESKTKSKKYVYLL